MKVGDLVKFKNTIGVRDKVFLILRTEMVGFEQNARQTEMVGFEQKVWIYPDPDADEGYDHTDDDNYYYAHYFEVISESR